MALKHLLEQAKLTNKHVIAAAGLQISEQTLSRYLLGQRAGGPTSEVITGIVVVAARTLGTTVDTLLDSYPSLRNGVDRYASEGVEPVALLPDSTFHDRSVGTRQVLDVKKPATAHPEPQDPRLRRLAHVLRSPARTEIKRIDIIQSNLFAVQSIEFDRLTAVVGTHGTGKSALLGMLHAAFGQNLGGMPKPPVFGNGFNSSSISAVLDLTVAQGDTERTIRIDLATDPSVRKTQWEEAFDDLSSPVYTSPGRMLDSLGMYTQNIGWIREARHRDSKTFEAIKECVRKYSRTDLNGLRNILGRSYKSAAVYMINDMDLEGDMHVEATLKLDDRTIDTTMMSLGEIWTHWLLGWETAFEDQAPILIDEPESYLARRGHTALTDELIRRALELEMQIILATHSAEVLIRFPLSNIRMCTPSKNGILVSQPSDIGKIQDALGLENTLRLIILVEGNFDATLVEHLCALLDSSLIREVEIVPAGGKDAIIHTLKAVHASRRIRYVGILAGNMRDDTVMRTSIQGTEIFDRIKYLPGSESPEEELMQTAHRYGDTLAATLSRSTADIYAALNASDHLDKRYRLPRFAAALDLPSPDIMVHALTQLWLRQSTEAFSQAYSLISSLRKAVED
ncbi:ATP-dependent nuclease [Nocardia tengchongensis]|uniref:ATP-dependent nuclease n=1 Tax=Nocardia tengchongensis TaxID=2055889 RepID=UPI0036A2FFBF